MHNNDLICISIIELENAKSEMEKTSHLLDRAINRLKSLNDCLERMDQRTFADDILDEVNKGGSHGK